MLNLSTPTFGTSQANTIEASDRAHTMGALSCNVLPTVFDAFDTVDDYILDKQTKKIGEKKRAFNYTYAEVLSGKTLYYSGPERSSLLKAVNRLIQALKS